MKPMYQVMLAATLENLEDVKFPVYVSPKLDGIRCLIHNGQAVSRALKPIPNKYVQEKLKGLPDGLDGELMLASSNFNIIQSAIMSEDGEPDFVYCIFDKIYDTTFENRFKDLKQVLLRNKQPIKIVNSHLATEVKHIYAFEKYCIENGYEGIILRSPNSPYKFGRSTVKEGYLLKYKRFKDAEADIIGFEELTENRNEKTKDNLGHSKRSTHKAGLIPNGSLGSLIVFDEKLKVEFNIGTGFTHEQRLEIWNNRKKYDGKTVTYMYQELSAKGKPRFPVFKGFRNDLDM